MSEEELIDTDVEQSLDDAVSDLRAIANQLDASGDELTIEYGGQSGTVPAPTGDVEFEVELERETEDGTVEIELELELEWEVPGDTTGDETTMDDDDEETDENGDDELRVE